MNGIIINRLFTEGSEVEEGQQLYQIDPALYEAELASAQADLFKAKANFDTYDAKVKRLKALVQKNAVSEQNYEDALLELEQAKAGIAISKALVKKAQINLNYTKVYAPISGQIGKSSVTKGALVTANQQNALATITRLNPIYVDLTQPSVELMRLRSHIENNNQLKVTLYLDNGQIYPEPGELQFSDVTVDETTDSVSLRSIFPNPKGILLPGLFVQAKIFLERKEAILVPQSAVIRDQQGNAFVWKLGEENTVNPQPVTIGQSHQNCWDILEGLNPNDVIILNGFQKIRPGAKVVPSKPKQDA